MSPGRRLGIDVGDVRIGVAVSDPEATLAIPVETVPAGRGAVARIVALADEFDAVECVVGLPLSLSGREGPAARKVRSFVAELEPALGQTPVRWADERLTTTTADHLVSAGGRSGRAKRAVIDQAAAVVILQSVLDADRGRTSGSAKPGGNP